MQKGVWMIVASMAILVLALTPTVAISQPGGSETDPMTEGIAGEIGASAANGCGWLVLTGPTDFHRGETIRLQVGGTAKKVLVRLLPVGGAPETATGLVGGPLTVPENRFVDLTLETDRNAVVQISVHGGPNPWGDHPLGASNGPATLASVELIGASPAPAVPADSMTTEENAECAWHFIEGNTGSSPRWGSGWLDLTGPRSFEAGDQIRLRLGGTAARVVVRLLSQGVSPETSAGVEGGAIEVPSNREVVIRLGHSRSNIVQISVHGHPNPFGTYRLGADNGPATLESAEVCPHAENAQ